LGSVSDYKYDSNLINNFLYLYGVWEISNESLIHGRETLNFEDHIALKFCASTANVVVGNNDKSNPYIINVKIDGSPVTEVNLGDDVFIAVENNNYYPTKAYRDVTEAKFISEIVYDNDLRFLFDIAHAKVTCFNKDINFERYKSELPLDRVIQVHICSYRIDSEMNQAYDAHDYPNSEELLEIKKIISEYPNVKYLTVEYYRDIENLEISLEKVRELVWVI